MADRMIPEPKAASVCVFEPVAIRFQMRCKRCAVLLFETAFQEFSHWPCTHCDACTDL